MIEDEEPETIAAVATMVLSGQHWACPVEDDYRPVKEWEWRKQVSDLGQ